MSSETLKNFDLQESEINSGEKQQETIKQETDRLYSSLDNFNLEQINSLVDNLSANNPNFKKELTKFQDNNSTIVVEMLKVTNNINNIKETKNPNFDYFWINISKISEIQSELESLDLDINKLLEWYKTYIETNLNWLNEEQINKVKQSISNKILTLWVEIEVLKWDLENWENFKNNRWIINEKIQDNFSDINNKILPSLALFSKINSWEHISLQENWIYDIKEQFEEIKRMLWAEVLSDWDFDKTWKSMELIDANINNWNILDNENKNDKQFLNENWIKSIEWISLLNENDKQVEKTAQYTFYALLAVQIWLEFTPVWWTAWAWIDWTDIFTDEEVLLTIAKWMPWVNNDYKAEKTWIDNTLAWIWLIPWATILTKSPKLTNWIFELNPWDLKGFMEILDKSLNNIAKKFWWSADYVNKIKHSIESLFLWTKQWLPETYINAIEESEYIQDWINLLKRHKYWESKGIDYKKLITDYVKNNEYWVTLEEAHAIYWYTNWIFIEKLNNALRTAKTPDELKAIKEKSLVKYLISWLSKMPLAKNKQFRWDDFVYNSFKVWEEKVMNWVTSSANSSENAFWEYAHLIIDDAKARDISSLAFFVHHADRIWKTKTTQESVIEPWAKIKIINKEAPSTEHPEWFMEAKRID